MMNTEFQEKYNLCIINFLLIPMAGSLVEIVALSNRMVWMQKLSSKIA